MKDRYGIEPSGPNRLRKFCSQFMFAFRSRWPAISTALAILLFLLFDCSVGWKLVDPLKNTWDKEINQVVTVATLVIALSVWCGDIVRGWRASLPKKMTVEFLYSTNENLKADPLPVMRCIYAELSDVADIRALGQQIGSQLANPDDPKRHLSFRAPYVKQGKPVVQYLPDTGFFEHYDVQFTLTKLPEELNPAKCKEWRAPFRKMDIT